VSVAWKLHNIETGDGTMQAGKMDISFDDDGGVDELTDPEAVLSQRIEKCCVEPQGSNPFSSGWGSPFANTLGEKMVPAERGREVAAGLRLMIGALISEQTRVARKVPLDPAETVVGLASSQIAFSPDTMTVDAIVRTGSGATNATAVL
jgi:hypothetical protein